MDLGDPSCSLDATQAWQHGPGSSRRPPGPGLMCPFRHAHGEKSVVCKHWLRGLCKKGDHCEFLHEYDVTKMPECYFYSKFGACRQLGMGTMLGPCSGSVGNRGHLLCGGNGQGGFAQAHPSLEPCSGCCWLQGAWERAAGATCCPPPLESWQPGSSRPGPKAPGEGPALPWGCPSVCMEEGGDRCNAPALVLEILLTPGISQPHSQVSAATRSAPSCTSTRLPGRRTVLGTTRGSANTVNTSRSVKPTRGAARGAVRQDSWLLCLAMPQSGVGGGLSFPL